MESDTEDLSKRDLKAEMETALQEDEQNKAETRKRYNLKEAVRRANEIITVVDDTLGEVRFGLLTVEEFQALELQNKSKETMLQSVVAAMFKKADPEITLEIVKALPADDYTILASIMGKYLPGFLRWGNQIQKASSPG